MRKKLKPIFEEEDKFWFQKTGTNFIFCFIGHCTEAVDCFPFSYSAERGVILFGSIITNKITHEELVLVDFYRCYTQS